MRDTNGIDTQLVYDASERKLHVKRTQDVESILDANKRDYDPDAKRFGKSSFHRMASIPLIVVEDWKQRLGVDVLNPDHAPRVAALLNSNEYRYLRVRPGRI